MYEIDHKLTNDETICSYCERVINKLHVIKTWDDNQGCTECIEYCSYCGRPYFSQSMFLCPYFDLICDECLKTDDYRHSVRNRVLKEALRTYFDKIDHGRIEDAIIQVAELMGFTDLANEMKSDKN